MRRRGGSEHPIKARRAGGGKTPNPSTAAPSIADLQKQVGTITCELKEANERQTATAEVLQVINSSPGDLAPVFNAMLGKALGLCEAKFGIVMLAEGDAFRLGAAHNAPQAFAEFMQRGPVRPNPQITFGRAVATKRVAQTADITIEQPYLQGDPLAVAAANLGGYRTVLAVPMLKASRAGEKASLHQDRRLKRISRC